MVWKTFPFKHIYVHTCCEGMNIYVVKSAKLQPACSGDVMNFLLVVIAAGLVMEFVCCVLRQWEEQHLPCFVPGKDTVIPSTAAGIDNLLTPLHSQARLPARVISACVRTLTAWQDLTAHQCGLQRLA